MERFALMAWCRKVEQDVTTEVRLDRLVSLDCDECLVEPLLFQRGLDVDVVVPLDRLARLVFTGLSSASTCVSEVSRCWPSRMSRSGSGIVPAKVRFSMGRIWNRTSPPVSSSMTAPTGKERATLTSSERTCSSSQTQPR